MASEDLQPYRVEHRHPNVVPWTLVREVETHDEARAVAAGFVRKYPAERCRVIVQHVIEYVGSG